MIKKISIVISFLVIGIISILFVSNNLAVEKEESYSKEMTEASKKPESVCNVEKQSKQDIIESVRERFFPKDSYPNLDVASRIMFANNEKELYSTIYDTVDSDYNEHKNSFFIVIYDNEVCQYLNPGDVIEKIQEYVNKKLEHYKYFDCNADCNVIYDDLGNCDYSGILVTHDETKGSFYKLNWINIDDISELDEYLENTLNKEGCEEVKFQFDATKTSVIDICSRIDEFDRNRVYDYKMAQTREYALRHKVVDDKIDVKLNWSSFMDEKGIKDADEIIDQLIKDNGFNSGTEYQKVKKVYSYITSHFEYDEKKVGTMNQPYSALIEGKACCLGYSTVLQRFMEKIGIKSRVLKGNIIKDNELSEYHAWNNIMLDGKWYHADSCWDSGKKTSEYKYFLIGSDNVKYNNNIKINSKDYID